MIFPEAECWLRTVQSGVRLAVHIFAQSEEDTEEGREENIEMYV